MTDCLNQTWISMPFLEIMCFCCFFLPTLRLWICC